MKKLLLFAAIVCFAGSIQAQKVKVEAQKYVGWGADQLSFNKSALIIGDQNIYGVNLVTRKPDKKGNTRTYMVLTEPRRLSGFGQSGCDFLALTVNKIHISRIVPNENSFKTWTKGDSAGCTAVLNFDGTKIRLDAYMKQGSPLLWMTFSPVEKQAEPMKSCRITLSCVISGMKIVKGKHIDYKKFAKTAARELTGQKDYRKAHYTLNASDRYLILGDSVLDGSKKGAGFGPSFVLLPENFDAVKKGTLILNNGFCNQFFFDMKPDFKEFTIAIWQNKGVISNQNFMKMFESSKKKFLGE